MKPKIQGKIVRLAAIATTVFWVIAFNFFPVSVDAKIIQELPEHHITQTIAQGSEPAGEEISDELTEARRRATILRTHYSGWLAAIDDCPCTQQEAEANPRFTDATHIRSDEYHPGAKWDYRTVEEAVNEYPSTTTPVPEEASDPLMPGQQCIYDRDGDLITHGPGAGTPDAYSPEVTYPLQGWVSDNSHTYWDVDPFDADGMTVHEYHRTWTPNVGQSCSINPPLEERKGKQRRGRNFGDPHLFTFDGHRYSFQDVGEFILAKSDDNFFEVQVRQSPISSDLAVDSAIAMAVGDTRVALYADPKDLPDSDTSTPLRIDGKPVKLRKELKLDNGGKVYHKGSAYAVEWPTKEKIVAQLNSDSENPFLNLSVFVFESQADHIMGLLGNDNGKKEDDLRFRDGRVLPSRSTYGDLKNILNRVVKVKLPIDPALNAYLKKLTKEYGNSWRISQEESLFDYAPGMATTSFTLKGFPSEYLTLSQLPTNLVSNAQKTCRKSGVDPEMMEGCVFDVAYSGYGGFARAAAQASQVMDVLEDLGIRVPRPRLPGGLKLPGGIRFPKLPW